MQTPLDPDAEFKANLKKVKGKLGASCLKELAEAYCGDKMKAASLSALYKFLSDETGGNSHDKELLRRFVSESETAALILSAAGGAQDHVNYIIGAFSAPEAHADDTRPFNGSYFCRHASYRHEDHYVIRLITFTPRRGGIVVDDYLNDEKTEEGATLVHKARGVVAFHKTDATILLRRQDNAVRFNMITIADVNTATGQMTGQMAGVSFDREHFFRTVILSKIGRSVIEPARYTGIFPWDEIDKDPTGSRRVIEALKNAPSVDINDELRKRIPITSNNDFKR